jgi:hypothetical protein
MARRPRNPKDSDYTGPKNPVLLPSQQEIAVKRNYETRFNPNIPRRVASGRGGAVPMGERQAISAASLMDRSVYASPLATMPWDKESRAYFKGDEWNEYYDYDQAGYDYSNLSQDAFDANTPLAQAERLGLAGQSRAPAEISLIPTSTIDYERPRTVAAGYDEDRQVLTVIFRDGTFYNYYTVSPGEWESFKVQESKGRYIKSFLDAKPRGTANMNAADMLGREGAYRIARTGQWVFQGQLGGQGDRTMGTPTPYSNQGERLDPTKQRTRRRK